MAAAKHILVVIALSGLLPMLSMSAHADGLPFTADRKDLTCPTITFKLTKAQALQVERERKFTPNDEQRNQLKAYTTKKVPHTWDVLTPRYRFCTCGLHFAAVWFEPDEVKIPIFMIPGPEQYDKFYDEKAEPKPGQSVWDHEGVEPASVTFVLDLKGKIFLDGKEATDEVVKSAMQALVARKPSTPKKSIEKWVSVSLPFYVDAQTERVFKDAVERIKAISQSFGLKCQSDEIQLEEKKS